MGRHGAGSFWLQISVVVGWKWAGRDGVVLAGDWKIGRKERPEIFGGGVTGDSWRQAKAC